MLLKKLCFSLIFALLVCLALPEFAATAGAAEGPELHDASWYGVGDGYGGQITASGEVMNPYDFTAASPYLPFGTLLLVCYDECVTVRVNDRGPYAGGRTLDLSYAAAVATGLINPGVGTLTVYRL